MFLEIGAVGARPEEPFRFTSGWASPVYTDCRKLISYPRIRSTLMDFACGRILSEIGFENIDAVAGGETAGIPFAAWIADRLGLPMLYVRKKPKGFGRNARIEGDLKEGARVLLVEDLATDGGSKVGFAEALREAGATVDHTFVIFFYGVFPGVAEELAKAGLSLHSLVTWHDVLAVAKAQKSFPPETLAIVESFLSDPVTWSSVHGGRGGAG
ncbi:orotate phosphoribosyltransferase [Jiella sp. R10]|uniref:Orotate phosphoribosyltransferase n=2 Tax=Antarcticirhabdus aurantiaca TaxID=2606717 RepID=A0ACD4NY46_9HYPH|nr:orotate phosphoribosyltransferase [Jeongeuplla avenae]